MDLDNIIKHTTHVSHEVEVKKYKRIDIYII